MLRVWVQGAVWLLGCTLPLMAQSASCVDPKLVTNGPIIGGTFTVSDSNALKASGVTISDDANVTFLAGNCIHLASGFRATAGTAPTTFHAWLDPAPTIVSALPDSGTGASQQFTYTLSSAGGGSEIAYVTGILNTAINASGGCYFMYVRQFNQIYLSNSEGTAFSPGIVPGSSSNTGNFSTNCTIQGSGSTANVSGNQLVLKVA